MSAASVRWLHISDLHRGAPGDRSRWPETKRVVLDALRTHADSDGPPDVVFVSGDLAYSGKADEYKLVDETINEILTATGGEPVVALVPGNHDLTWPDRLDITASGLRQYHENETVRGAIKSQHQDSTTYLRRRFDAFDRWWTERIVADWNRRKLVHSLGQLPGDFLLSLDIRGIKVGVAGLNSAYLQLSDGDYERKLAVEQEQLLAAGELVAWCGEHDARLLIMHHPPGWLHEMSKRELFEHIYPPDRFTLLLHGHQHAHEGEFAEFGGDRARCTFQASSLLGLERWGTKNEVRACGYAWGSLNFHDTNGADLEIKPYAVAPQRAGHLRVVPDPHQEPLTRFLVYRPNRSVTLCAAALRAAPGEAHAPQAPPSIHP